VPYLLESGSSCEDLKLHHEG